MFSKNKLSTGELVWIGIIFWSVSFTAMEAPFSFTFKTNLQTWQLWADGFLSLIFIGDLFYHLRKHSRQEKIDHSPLGKTMWYTAVLVDTAACIPFDLLAWGFDLGAGMGIFGLLRLFRLVRIIKLFNIIQNMTVVPRWVKFQMILILSLIGIHWIACGWIILNPPGADIIIRSYYIKTLYWVVTTLTTVGYGDITPSDDVGRLFTMVIMIMGVGLYGLIIGNISRIFMESDRHKELSREKMQDLHLFMGHYNIPERLQSACFNYYNYVFQKRLSDNDTKIIGDLPHALQNELQTYMNMKLIQTVPVFKYCSHACLKAIAASLEQMYFSPGQNIINIGEDGQEMFIIGHGVVEVILKDGNIVASLHEGQFFGEAALLKQTTRNANVRAQTYCDLYKLKKEDFLHIIEKYPELLESMQKVTKKRSSDRRATST
ncbi:MAG: cyclic nucleotide-binding domain-containing protein [Halobacteriovoraceae bacterium]|jgi:hypothetical protein|nr:cyclic nucleotide-binding domain-containing protein [Halobacteriovoraceae bacterium]MBT5093639.1 cyclic nucleotide-binding domain-containing protein [Halobacteriovoraceae bacterium]